MRIFFLDNVAINADLPSEPDRLPDLRLYAILRDSHLADPRRPYVLAGGTRYPGICLPAAEQDDPLRY